LVSNTRDLNGTVSQWTHACMPSSGVEYPYGSSFDVNACNAKAGGTSSVRVATYPGCVGGVAGLYDMSGNVAEWSDHCDAYVGKDDYCAAEGGDYDPPNDSGDALICSLGQDFHRDLTAINIGFRCCSNP
jgi:sulfatase modifying factor 1